MPLNYLQKRKRCGKARCRTCQEAGGHGPYWYVSQTIGGRTIEKYVGKQLPSQVQQAIGRTEQSQFIGRTNELAHLMQILETTEQIRHPHSSTRQISPASAHTIILTGEMGMGKTRVAEEVAREAVLRNWPVIWVSSVQENNSPYRLWTQMLRTALAQGLWKRLGVSRQPERYRPLHFLLPDVLDLWSEETRPPEPLHLWESMRLLLDTISEKTTVLLVFDDLHWADNGSCELLAYLTRHMRGTRMVFLCTCRESDLSSDRPLDRLLTHLQDEQAVEVLPIAPLSNEQIQELISYVPIDLAKRIALHTGGNPLFAEELARSSVAGDLADVFRATRHRELPATVSTVLALRLAHLSSECQRLLECGAVLGDAFPFVAVYAMGSEIMDLTEELLIDLLEEAMQAGTITEEGGGTTISYHFWHPLLRTHLYNHLSAARRASLHRRAAHVLQDLAAGRVAEYAAQIAHHLTQGGDTSDLIAYYAEMAANYAYSLSAYEDAAHFCQQVLGYVRLMLTTPEQQEHEATLLELLAECTRIQGKAGLARAYYEQALYLHQALHSTVEIQAMLQSGVGLCWFDEGNLVQARQYYTRGEESLSEAGLKNGFAWAKLRYEQGYNALCEGKYQEARLLALEALSIFSRGGELKSAYPSHVTRLRRTLTGDPVDLGRVHTLLGLVANGAGQSEEALDELLKAYTIHVQYHQIRELAIICCNIGDLYMRRAAYEQATEALEEALHLAEKMGNVSLLSFTTGNLGIIALRQQELLMAADRIAQAFKGAEQCNEKAAMSFWSSYAGQVAIAQGQMKEARAHVVQALVYARQCHVEPYVAIALVTAATFHLTFPQTVPNNVKTGYSNKARSVLHRALSLSGIEAETRIEAQLVAARLADLEGHQEIAQTQAQTALDEALKCGVEWLVPLARKWLS